MQKQSGGEHHMQKVKLAENAKATAAPSVWLSIYEFIRANDLE